MARSRLALQKREEGQGGAGSWGKGSPLPDPEPAHRSHCGGEETGSEATCLGPMVGQWAGWDWSPGLDCGAGRSPAGAALRGGGDRPPIPARGWGGAAEAAMTKGDPAAGYGSTCLLEGSRGGWEEWVMSILRLHGESSSGCLMPSKDGSSEREKGSLLSWEGQF